MQANDGKDNKDGGGEDEETTNEEGKEESQNEDEGTNEEEGDGATTTTTSDPGEETAAAPARVLPLHLIVPTKTYDGGLNNEQAAQVQAQVQAVHHQSGETETTIASDDSNTPDLFQVYSDTDTRMRTLLGIEQSNPNEAEADWRQLTGFQGTRDEELRRNNDGGDDNGATPRRRTRVTTELHSSAFDHMLIGELGELDLDEILLRLQARQQEEENDGHELDELLRRLQVRQEEENHGHELDEDRQQQGGR